MLFGVLAQDGAGGCAAAALQGALLLPARRAPEERTCAGGAGAGAGAGRDGWGREGTHLCSFCVLGLPASAVTSRFSAMTFQSSINSNGYVAHALHPVCCVATPVVVQGEDTTVVYVFLNMLLNLLALEPPPTHFAVVFDAAGKSFRWVPACGRGGAGRGGQGILDLGDWPSLLQKWQPSPSLAGRAAAFLCNAPALQVALPLLCTPQS